MFGKKPFVRTRGRDWLRFAELLRASTAVLPPPPASVRWGGVIADLAWAMLDNCGHADCTTAAACHMVMCWTATAAGAPAAIAQNAALDAYKRVTPDFGHDPDGGAYCQDVLHLWRSHGIGGRTITDYALLDDRSIDQVKQCIALFGACYIGAQLPDLAKPDAQCVPPSWDLTAAQLHGAPKNPANGHCVAAIGYDANALDVVTWGRRVRMSWDFFTTYMDEAWAVLSVADWTAANGRTPSNLDSAQLAEDFDALRTASGLA